MYLVIASRLFPIGAMVCLPPRFLDLDIDLAIKEIYRLLKDGGGFIFTEPNMLNPQVALERKVPLMRKIANNSQDETAFIR